VFGRFPVATTKCSLKSYNDSSPQAKRSNRESHHNRSAFVAGAPVV
jgi:hypothetical protein